MFEKIMRELQQLASARVKELNVPTEDQVARVRVYLARNGHLVTKQLESMPFQKCLFKHIAPLSELLEINIDQKLLRVSEENTREDVLCNRIKLEQYLSQIEFNGKTYFPLGATGSLKEGKMWFGTEQVRSIVHAMFPYSEGAATYLGILLSQSWEGSFESSRITVYEETIDDGMGYIRKSFSVQNGIYAQSQVRIIDIQNKSAAKGTLLPMEDSLFSKMFGQDKDIAINSTLIKTESKIFQDAIISVRAIAKYRHMKSSFQVLQHITQEGLAKLKPTLDKHLDDIFMRFTDKQKAVDELKIKLVEEENALLADTKLSMALLSNLPVTHPWIQNRLTSLWLKEIQEIALGGGLEFTSGQAAYDPSLKQGEVRFHHGSVFLNPKDISEREFGDYDGDLIPSLIDREKREAIVTRYPIVQASAILKLKIVGDIPAELKSNPLAVDVLTNHVKRLLHVNSPETKKKRTPLTNLLSVLLDGSVGGGIGGSTLALAAAVAHGKDDLSRELTLYSQEDVLSFKHYVNRQAMVKPYLVLKELVSPEWFGINPQRLFDFKAVEYPGTVSACWNYVCSRIRALEGSVDAQRRPLNEFRGLIPIPKSFRRREFIRVYEYYKRYCRLVSQAMEKQDEEALNRVIKATEIIGMGMSDTEIALAFHISHMANRGLGAFPIHLGINQLVKLLGYSEISVPVMGEGVVSRFPLEKLEDSVSQKHVDLCLKKLFAA